MTCLLEDARRRRARLRGRNSKDERVGQKGFDGVGGIKGVGVFAALRMTARTNSSKDNDKIRGIIRCAQDDSRNKQWQNSDQYARVVLRSG
jgi:hypothetical protein